MWEVDSFGVIGGKVIVGGRQLLGYWWKSDCGRSTAMVLWEKVIVGGRQLRGYWWKSDCGRATAAWLLVVK